GSEIYLSERPELLGRTYGEALFAYAQATAIGIASPGRPPRLNPPAATIFAPGDRLIAIAGEAADLNVTAEPAPIDVAALDVKPVPPQRPDHTLISGWNWRVPGILEQLNNYVAPNPTATICADVELSATIEEQLPAALANMAVRIQIGN